MGIKIISPGHGGKDPGAVFNGLVEKDLTMFVAVRTEDRLDAYDGDFKIFQLPNVTAVEDLSTLANYAKEVNADFILEIHVNSYSESRAHGMEAFYPASSSDGNLKMYQTIFKSIEQYCNDTGMYVRGLKSNSEYFVLNLGIPCLLVEIGFMTNPRDAEKLDNYKWLDKFANALAWGCVDAFKLKPNYYIDEYVMRTVRQRLASISVDCQALVELIDKRG
jgi:N-acetylmuramoyl-L-alanine amidase